jgi:hypothetical protein
MFENRIHEKELLDQPGIPEMDIRRNMYELGVINSYLGGNACSLEGLKKSMLGWQGKQIQLVEVGCGNGEQLYFLYQWLKKRGYEVHCTGIDFNASCIQMAGELVKHHEDFEWICSPYQEVELRPTGAIIFSSLFCHHLNDTELEDYFYWCIGQQPHSFFVNDLHRHPLAYYSIKVITQLFSSSYLVKNDAPLSVLRGFQKKDWERVTTEIKDRFPEWDFQMECKWAFRWLITGQKAKRLAATNADSVAFKKSSSHIKSN